MRETMMESNNSLPVNSTTDLFSNLTDEQKQHVSCVIASSDNVQRFDDISYCEPIFDGLHCWFATPVNTTVNKTCPLPEGTFAPEGIYAFRYCQLDKEWENATNYNMCIDYIDTLQQNAKDKSLAMILRDIYFVCSVMSLVLLIITLFIFSYFRSLQCTRLSIHKNLVASFIFRFIMIIITIEPFVTGRDSASYRNYDWLCKILLTLSQYTQVAIIFWMFVEGLFLHNRIVVSVFSTESPLKLFVFIGWGLPGVIVLAWLLPMILYDKNFCWDHYPHSSFMYILIAPFLAALIINSVFLINIIRVLVTKLKTNNSEAAQIKKAIKATVILMPLLGLTNMLFLWNPEDGSSLQTAYHVTNAILHSTQGIFVSILYCFLNGEVRRVIKRKWDRFILRRFPRASGKRRNSRTSSFILSQTEAHHHPCLSMTTENNHVNNKSKIVRYVTDPLLENGANGKLPYDKEGYNSDDSELPKIVKNVTDPLLENGANGKLPYDKAGYNSDDSDLSNQIRFTIRDIDDVLDKYQSDSSFHSDDDHANSPVNHKEPE